VTAYRHPCPYCPVFWVDEVAPTIVTDFRDDSTITVKVTRAAWELSMVQHWFAEHPDRFQVVFPGVVLVSDALLATAARAQDQVNRTLQHALASLPG
jgi:hypothetical protein